MKKFVILGFIKLSGLALGVAVGFARLSGRAAGLKPNEVADITAMFLTRRDVQDLNMMAVKRMVEALVTDEMRAKGPCNCPRCSEAKARAKAPKKYAPGAN